MQPVFVRPVPLAQLLIVVGGAVLLVGPIGQGNHHVLSLEQRRLTEELVEVLRQVG